MDNDTFSRPRPWANNVSNGTRVNFRQLDEKTYKAEGDLYSNSSLYAEYNEEIEDRS